MTHIQSEKLAHLRNKNAILYLLQNGLTFPIFCEIYLCYQKLLLVFVRQHSLSFFQTLNQKQKLTLDNLDRFCHPNLFI